MKILAFMVFLLLPGYLFAQEESMPQIVYLKKGALFPFDSGVAMNDAQYQYIYRNIKYKEITSTVDESISRPPKIVFIDRPVTVKNKGDGKHIVWGAGGVLLGALLILIVK